MQAQSVISVMGFEVYAIADGRTYIYIYIQYIYCRTIFVCLKRNLIINNKDKIVLRVKQKINLKRFGI